MSKLLWCDKLYNRRVVFYIDNDAARHSLVSMYSPSTFSNEILSAVLVADMSCMTLNWYARVPTIGNLADGPSRMSMDDMEHIGAKRVRASFPELRPWTADSVRHAISQHLKTCCIMIGFVLKGVWAETQLASVYLIPY